LLFCHAGTCFSMPNLLTSGQLEVAEATVKLIYVISEHSAYARDAVLCMEIHDILIALAKRCVSPQLTGGCCQCLLRVFATTGGIDSEVLIRAAHAMVGLLGMDSVEVVSAVLDCYVQMSNKYTTLVVTLYDLGLFSLAVQLLDNAELAPAALRLVGNLCVAQPAQIRTMLDVGLIHKTIAFLETEHAADAFWVMSNLLEMVPHEIIPLDDGAVARVLEIIATSSYDVQKEAAFFLSALILLTSASLLPKFMIQSVMEPLVDMLGCGVRMVALKCAWALVWFCKSARESPSAAGALAAMLTDSDLRSRLDDLLDERDPSLLTESAEILMAMYGSLAAGD